MLQAIKVFWSRLKVPKGERRILTIKAAIKTSTIEGMKKYFLFAFFVTLVIYFFSSPGNTPFDYFTRLADAFLRGRYWLDNNPPWLTELIPSGPGKFFVVYPPMPAILSLPFVYLFGNKFYQNYLSFLLGGAVTVLTMAISWKVTKSKKISIWSGFLIGLGSIVWFMSSVGSSWYLGQITACLFISLAILEGLTKKRPFVVGILLGAAYLSRIDTIVSLPFFLFLLRKNFIKNAVAVGLGLAPFLVFNAVYNFVRYGVIWDQSYFLLPKVLHEENAPWFAKGVENPVYLLDNLKILFWSFPKILNTFPYVQPSWMGLAIWITTPAFLFSIFAPLKDNLVKFSWFSILLIFLIVGSHGGTGFAQFGYRFAVDFYPFLTLLTVKGVKQTGLKWFHWVFLILGMLVNLWGVVWINKFGWVSY